MSMLKYHLSLRNKTTATNLIYFFRRKPHKYIFVQYTLPLVYFAGINLFNILYQLATCEPIKNKEILTFTLSNKNKRERNP